MDTSHLPPDLRDAIAKYDQDIKDGVITFPGQSAMDPVIPGMLTQFAAAYPGKDAQDQSIARWAASHIPGEM